VLEKFLWGNFYFDQSSRKFLKKPTAEATKRSFVEFILEPIYKIFSHVVSKEKEEVKTVLSDLRIYLSSSDYKLDIKPLLKLVFKKFFGNNSALVSMMVKHIPSPKTGTKIKTDLIYSGDKNSEVYKKIC